MDYKSIAALLNQNEPGQPGAGLTDYQLMAANRKAATQAQLAGLEEEQALIDYTTPPQLRDAKLAQIQADREAIAQEMGRLDKDGAFLQRYADSHRQIMSPEPVLDRTTEPFMVPSAKDLINQPQLSKQTFTEDRPVIDTTQLYENPVYQPEIPGAATLAEFLRSIPRGGANAVASIPALEGTLAADSHRQALAFLDQSETLLRRMAELKRQGMDEQEFMLQAAEMLDGTPQAIRYKITNALGRINDNADPDAVIAEYRADIESLPLETAQTSGYKWAQEMHDDINAALPVRPGYEDSFTRKLGEGTGSIVPAIGGYLIGGPVGGAAIGMGMMGGSGVEEAVKDQKKTGATEDEIRNYGLASAAIGSLEALPVGKLLGRVPGLTGMIAKLSPQAQNAFVRYAQEVGEQALEEGGQEGVSQLLQNKAAQLTYDENRALFKDVPESVALGMIIGGGLKAGTSGIDAAIKADQPEFGGYVRTDTLDTGDSTAEPSPEPGQPGGTLGGLEGEVIEKDRPVAHKDPLAGIIEDTPLDLDANRLQTRAPEPEAPGTSLGGLEGEIVDKDRTPAHGPKFAGTLESPSIEGELVRKEVTGRRNLPGSTENYEVIDDGEPYDPREGEAADVKALEDYARKTTPSAPKTVEEAEDLDLVALDAQEPTEAQKEAGNYRKPHVKMNGLDIAIETPKGSVRRGKDQNGEDWEVEMPGHYGYIKRSTGMDGDHVDVTIGDKPKSKKVFVIDQVDADTKAPDEHKVIMGVNSEAEARALYEKQFSDGRGADRLGAITEMDAKGFKSWLKDGDTTKPLQQSVYDDQIAHSRSQQGDAYDAVAKRFDMTREEVQDVIDNPVETLRHRDRYDAPSNTETPTTDYPKHKVGSAKIGTYGDPNEAYVETLQEFDPNTLTPTEAEAGIKKDKSYKNYVKWAKDGSEPPPVFVAESDKGDGKLYTTNRRRTLAAQEAGTKLKGWYSRKNKETGLPLKYKDVRAAYDEAKARSKPSADTKTAEDENFEPPGFLGGKKTEGDVPKTGSVAEKDYVKNPEHLKNARTRLPKGASIVRMDASKPDQWSLRVGDKTVSEVTSAKLTNAQIDQFVRDAKKDIKDAAVSDPRGTGLQRRSGQPGSAGPLADAQHPRPEGKGSADDAAGKGHPARSAEAVRNDSPQRDDARRRNRGRVAARLRGFVEEDQTVELTHYGEKFLDTITPQDGWNTRGAEKGRAGDPDFVNRSYFGVGVGKDGGYKKDVKGGFGHKLKVDIDELYDAAEDPDGLNQGKGKSAYEKAIKDAGYSGYLTKVNNGEVAVIFHAADVTEHFEDNIQDRPDNKRAKGLEKSAKISGSLKRLFVGPVKHVRETKAKYAKESGIRPATTIREYVKVDEERAGRIAQAFEDMAHQPNDPLVKLAYEKLIEETLAQYQAMVDSGFKAEMMSKGQADPYPLSPRQAIDDIRDNNHMWVFPTDDGFGSSDLDVSDNPLLAPTKFKDVNGKVMLANDVFRAVHDYFGHAVEGNGMRARGEEMAWRVHASMYSPLARRAMTSETRGQNSWVNYGPHSAHNKTASGADTIYAPQKIGLLPEWASEEGLHDQTHLDNIQRMAAARRATQPKEGETQFETWFGDSKVTDQDGVPLVVYHGTDENFSVFSKDELGAATGAPSSKMGFFFASNPVVASSYAYASNAYRDVPWLRAINKLTKGWYEKFNESLAGLFGKSAIGSGANVMPVYLRIEKPLVVDFKGNEYRERTYASIVAEVKKNGHDGLILKNTFDEGFAEGGNVMTDVYVVFEPNQIKSKFNPAPTLESEDVLYKLAPGFYSALTKGIEGAKQKSAPAKDWKAIIAALPGVRKSEVEWLDVNGWLDEQDGQVSREDLVAYVKANEIEVHETILTDNGSRSEQWDNNRFHIDIDTDYTDVVDIDEEYLEQLAEDRMDEAREELEARLDEDEEIDEDEVKGRALSLARDSYYESPEYRGWARVEYGDGSEETLDFYIESDSLGYLFNGNHYDNYRDMKEAMEAYAEDEADRKGIDADSADYGTQYRSYIERGGANYREILLTIPELENKGPNAKRGDAHEYESSNFDRTPNLVVHARTTDRRRGQTLFVEEVQSDLSSDIRKAGGSAPTDEEKIRYQQMLEAQDRLRDDALSQSIELTEAIEAKMNEDRPTGRFDGLHTDTLRRFIRNASNYLGLMEKIANAPAGAYVQTPYGYIDLPIKDLHVLIPWVREHFSPQMDAWNEMSDKLRDNQLRINETRNPNTYEGSHLPDMPWSDETYPELAMKRLLRLAVDEGKSEIAWTPGYMQAKRWSQAVQNVVNKVEWGFMAGGDGTDKRVTLYGVNGTDAVLVRDGKMIKSMGHNIRTDQIVDKPLSELIGKKLADQVLSEDKGSVIGDAIVIGGEGYSNVYDRRIKNFMDKFAKKFGSSVELDRALMREANSSETLVQIKRDETVKTKDVMKALLDSGKFSKDGLQHEFDQMMVRYTTAMKEQAATSAKKLSDAEATLKIEVEKADSTKAELEGKGENPGETERWVSDDSSVAYMEGLVKSYKQQHETDQKRLMEFVNEEGTFYEFQAKSALLMAAQTTVPQHDLAYMMTHFIKEGGDPVWKVKITEKMRDAILEGQPFSLGRSDYQITPEAQNQIDELLAVIRKVAPGLDVRMAPSIDAKNNVWGKYSRDNGAITIAAIALQAGQAKQTFGHEALHAFVDHGLLTQNEIKILQAYAEKHDLISKYGLKDAYLQAYGPRGLDPADLQRMMNEEGLAELVGNMLQNPDEKLPGELKGIIGRLKRLLERIANAVRGLGFQNAEDILQKISSGEVGSRTPAGVRGSGDLYSLGHGHAVSIKRTTANDLGDFLATDRTVIKKARAAQRYLQDKFLSVKLLQKSLASIVQDDENAYLAEELSAARIPEQTQELNDQMQDVLETLHEAGVSREQFERFLRMRHAKERNEQIAKINTKFKDGGSGIKTRVAERWLRMARKLTPIDQWQAMKDAADGVYDILKKSLKIRLEGGLIDQAYYNELVNQYKYYVPLKGHEFLEDLKPIASNRGFGAKGSGLKQAMGRRSEAQNTLSYVVEDYRRAVYSAERNKVNIALFNFIKNSQNPQASDHIELDPIRYKRILVKKRGIYQGRKIWVPADFVGDDTKISAYLAGLEGNASERQRLDPTPAHNDLPVMIDGKRHIMRVKNDTLLNDLLDMHTNIETHPLLQKAMSGFTRMLTMWNPAFAPTNFARDVLGVGLTAGSELGAKEAFKVMKGAFRMTRVIMTAVGWKAVNPNDQPLLDLYKEMKLSGGSTGFSHVIRDAETIQKELETEAEWLAGNRTTTAALKHGVVAVDQFMEKFNRIFEDATRLAAYKNRLDAGDTKPQALSYAKNITVNFNKRGHQRFFSQWYAFANANLQGNYRTLRAVINGKNGKRVLGGLFAGGFLYGLANILMGYDDDEPEKINRWYEINQFDKAFYIMLGPLKLPKPHGWMIPFDIGTKAAELLMATIDPEHCNPQRRSPADLTVAALAEVAANASAFVPMGNQEDPVLRPVPTLLAPLASVATNRSPFGGSIYPEGFDRTQPNFKQFYAETPELYHKAARGLNLLSGGSDYDAGYINVSPEALEFLVSSYLGGAGGEFGRASALAMGGLNAALGNETKPIRTEDLPIVRRFLASQRTNALTDYYYQFNSRMQAYKNAVSEAKDGSDLARAYMQAHPVEAALLKQWEMTKKQRTAVRKQLDALDESRREGEHTGLRRDALIVKRGLIERRFARTYQIRDQIDELKQGAPSKQTQLAITKLERDLSVMQTNVAKLIADQDSLLASRPKDAGKVSSLSNMFK